MGVEIGQIVALSIMLVFFLLGEKWSHFKDSDQRFKNILLMLLDSFFSICNYMVISTAYVEEFPFNEDAHTHVHEDWEYEQSAEDPETNDSMSELQKLSSVQDAQTWRW